MSRKRLETVISDILTQIQPHWNGYGSSGLPKLIKYGHFHQNWEAVSDENGSYLDDSGRRIAIKKRLDEGSLSEAKDVHWAAHNAARLWLVIGVSMGRLRTSSQGSKLWRHAMQSMRNICTEEIRELAFQELSQIMAQYAMKPRTPLARASYTYPALLQDSSPIRLLVLLPSIQPHADIICELCNSTLSKNNTYQYEALSYVWGDSSKRKSITVGKQQFQATENLESALRHLRYPKEPRILWVDAICINQNDIIERNAQVRQMSLVYKTSARVIVWLGPESDGENVFEYMDDLPNFDISEFHRKKNDPTLAADYAQLHKSMRKAIPPVFAASERLLARPWFTRIWCIQEFALAPHAIFQCGRYNVPCEDFIRFCGYIIEMVAIATANGIINGNDIVNNGEFHQHYLKFLPLIEQRQEFGRSLQQKSALDILCAFRGWQSSDPRDLIFALYGLLPDQHPDKNAFEPDYKLDTAELYTRLAIYYIQKYHDLCVLSVATMLRLGIDRGPDIRFVSTNISDIHFLPSWVPDWQRAQLFGIQIQWATIGFSGPGTFLTSSESIYNASLGLHATPIFLQDDNQIIHLDGISVDTVDVIGDGLWSDDFLVQWKDIAHSSNQFHYQYTGEPVHEAFWRTILTDSQERDSGFSKNRIHAQCPKLKKVLEQESFTRHQFHVLTSLTFPNNSLYGRRFFKSSRGLFGLGPDNIKKGDNIVVLFGGKVPFITRYFEQHQLIGECYVHGIMDGEVIHEPRPESFQHLQTETFCLA